MVVVVVRGGSVRQFINTIILLFWVGVKGRHAPHNNSYTLESPETRMAITIIILKLSFIVISIVINDHHHHRHK